MYVVMVVVYDIASVIDFKEVFCCFYSEIYFCSVPFCFNLAPNK